MWMGIFTVSGSSKAFISVLSSFIFKGSSIVLHVCSGLACGKLGACMSVPVYLFREGPGMCSQLSSDFPSVCPSHLLIFCHLSSVSYHLSISVSVIFSLYIHWCVRCLSICPPICVSILASSLKGLRLGPCSLHWLRRSCFLFIVLCLWCIPIITWVCACRRTCPCVQQDMPMCSHV